LVGGEKSYTQGKKGLGEKKESAQSPSIEYENNMNLNPGLGRKKIVGGGGPWDERGRALFPVFEKTPGPEVKTDCNPKR